MGKITAELAIKAGAQVILSDFSVDQLNETAAKIGATPVAADVSKEQDIINLASAAVGKFDRIDVWINNAGIWMPHTPAEEMDLNKVRKMFDVNIFGTIYGSISAIKQMKHQGSGVIVNIISASALEGRPLSSGYCASKFAVSGFTKSIREELRQSGIKVIGIYPDKMKTGLFNENKPADYDSYLSPEYVANRIVVNLQNKVQMEELVVKSA
ncbi:MAG: 3-oxoacyl-[acyl-carrier protein] reductase [Parcubacteria group bacterium Licking1014_17]|nr:MAG: 3-oxoacyl-[acyl-carrier protein] reductase [Parcubacteria group bacterium Licking1014_17]